MNEFWSRRTCVILTGASKGIGQSLAVEISKLLIPESTIVLLARDTNGLEKTKEMVNKENKDILIEVCITKIINAVSSPLKFMIYDFSIIVLICTILMQLCLKKCWNLLILLNMNYLC
jgi:short-subunit dehydrogenase